MSSTRIKGSALSLTFDGVDYWTDIVEARMPNTPDGDPIRAHTGTVLRQHRQYYLQGRAVQSLDSGSFWRYCWDNVLKIVDFRYAPLGNHTPTTNAPHFVGRVQIGPRPTVGGAAGNNEFEFEFEWEIVDDPVLDTGAPQIINT